MFRLGVAYRQLIKPFMDIKRNFQVAVIGGSHPIGRSVSLLLKRNPLIHRFTMYDFFEDTVGVAKDLSNIPRQPFVESCTGRIEAALYQSDLVVITGGKQRKSRQNDLSLFRDNANFIMSAMHEVKMYCPDAFIVLATEPINYLVPLASKILLLDGVYENNKLLGVTGLDTMRTQTCVSKIYDIPANMIKVPVICGHSTNTIVPLLSNVKPRIDIDDNNASTIIKTVRHIDDSISGLMFGKGITLSAAYAIYCTTSAVLHALNGSPMEDVAFIANNDFGTKFFASPVNITNEGVSAKARFHCITDQEATLIRQAADHLKCEVRCGEFHFTPTGMDTLLKTQ